ncbi:MAG: phosphoribosylglycinamide formyltransferase [Gammaproteobacteria bacterium]|nr:phosphoribosylglycinamide formyltransferase [Gammaproteobacteria bacterium]
MSISCNPIDFNVVVLISGSGSNLQALIDAQAAGAPYRIAAVISNRADAYGLQRAAQAGIATQVLDHREYPDRESYDQALIAAIDQFQPSLLALAGFMRILSAGFVRHYSGRLLNIHPSLLPKYKGLHTHQRALDAGDQEHGCSVHFVSEELDGGPVILQAKVAVLPEDSADALATRVLKREHFIYPLCLRWFAEDRLRLNQGQVELEGAALAAPVVFAIPQEPG